MIQMIQYKNDRRTYDNIRKIATGQGDDYTTSCLLHYVHFQSYYKMIVIDLSKQQALDADPKEIQQIDFIRNLRQAENKFFSLLKKRKKLF